MWPSVSRVYVWAASLCHIVLSAKRFPLRFWCMLTSSRESADIKGKHRRHIGFWDSSRKILILQVTISSALLGYWASQTLDESVTKHITVLCSMKLGSAFTSAREGEVISAGIIDTLMMSGSIWFRKKPHVASMQFGILWLVEHYIEYQMPREVLCQMKHL